MVVSRDAIWILFYGLFSLLAAFATHIPLVYLTALTFLTVFLFSMLWCIIAARLLIVEEKASDLTIEEGGCRLQVKVKNGFILPIFNLRLQHRVMRAVSLNDPYAKDVRLKYNFVDDRIETGKEGYLVLDYVPPRAVASGRFMAEFPSGGMFLLGELICYVVDPLGLFAARRTVKADTSTVILPRWQEHDYLPVRHGGRSRRNVSRRVMHREGNSDHFLGTREFQPGDPMRKIHWLASARSGQMVTKQFEENIGEEFLVIHDLDLPLNQLSGKEGQATLKALLLAGANVLRYLEKNGHRYGLLVNNGQESDVTLGGGEEFFARAMERLTCSLPYAGEPLESTLGNLPRGLADSALILISSRTDSSIPALAASLADNGQAVTLITVSPSDGADDTEADPGTTLDNLALISAPGGELLVPEAPL